MFIDDVNSGKRNGNKKGAEKTVKDRP